MVGEKKIVADRSRRKFFCARGAMVPALLGCWLAVSVFAKDVAEYRLGDRIEEDIFTPVPLSVVDTDATETLKQKEIARVPVILRHDPSVVDQVEGEIRALFAQNRSNFVNALKVSFKRAKLTEADLASAKFQRQLATFKRQNRNFPLSTNLAVLWARGDSGRVVQAGLIARVRETLSRPIRALALPEGVKLGYTVRMVTVTRPDEVLTLTAADQRGVTILRSNLTTVSRARTNLAGLFPPDEQAFGKFAAARLRPNTFVETELTLQDRARRTASLQSVNQYEAGQRIARAGQKVDKNILVALDQMRERTAPVRLQEQLTVQQAQAAQIQRRNQWIIAALAAATLLSILVAWQLSRRRQKISLLPARVTDPGGAALATSPGKGNASVQAGMFAQLTLLFREKLVRGLIAQRSQLLDAQQMAAAEIADLEQRLNQLQAPLQERLRAYEIRIAELERALAAKGEENRELIKAKIQLIRKQLESERSRNRLVLN